MKKAIPAVLLIIVILIAVIPANAKDNVFQFELSDKHIFIDGIPLVTKDPILGSDTPCISVNDAFTSMGCLVKWNDKDARVEISTPQYISSQKKPVAPYIPKPCSVIYNGKVYEGDFYAYRKNNGGVMLSPIVYTTEEKLYQYDFNFEVPNIPSNNTITLKNGTVLTIGKKEIQTLNNFLYDPDSKKLSRELLQDTIELIDGRVYVPIRDFLYSHRKSSPFGASVYVYYDDTRNVVYITEQLQGDLD